MHKMFLSFPKQTANVKQHCRSFEPDPLKPSAIIIIFDACSRGTEHKTISCRFSTGTADEKLRLLFDMYDTNGNEQLSLADVTAMFR